MTGSTASVRATGRLRVYARLAKLDVFDYYLAIPVVWALLDPADRFGWRVLATLLSFTAGTVGVLAATVTLDDVTGYRDGSDAANYGPDAPARRLARKPLLAGTLSVPQALRFAWCSGVAGAAGWLLAATLAPYRPGWALLTCATCLVVAVQYSAGLKLSYHGGQELILAGFGAGLVLAGSGLTGGRLDGFTVVVAVLFGLGPLLFGVYSNTNDVVGDAAVRRRTAATLLSPRGNTILIAALSAAEPGIVVLATATGIAPWWFPVVLLPTTVLRGRQARTGLCRGDILAARTIGIRAHRTTAAALVVAGLVVGGN